MNDLHKVASVNCSEMKWADKVLEGKRKYIITMLSRILRITPRSETNRED